MSRAEAFSIPLIVKEITGHLQPETVSYERRKYFVFAVIDGGRYDTVEETCEGVGLEVKEFFMIAAAAAGHVDMCRQIHEQLGFSWIGTLHAAAAAGKLSTCQELLDMGLTWSDDAFLEALRRGHEAFVNLVQRRPQYVQDHGQSSLLFMQRFVVCVAEGCDLAVLQRFFGEYRQTAPSVTSLGKVLTAAVSSPKGDWQRKAEWLVSQGCTFAPAHVLRAVKARRDAVQRLTWLRDHHDLTVSASDISEAEAEGLDLASVSVGPALLDKLLRIAHAGARYIRRLQARALEGGHLEMIMLLHEQGWDVNYDCVRKAAEGGHLEMVQWLLKVLGRHPVRGLHPSEVDNLMAKAVRSGSMPLLEWLHMQRCRCTPAAFEAALDFGCVSLMKWLVQHFPTDWEKAESSIRRAWIPQLGAKGDLAMQNGLAALS